MEISRGVITIATGKRVYWEMALNLARSFEYWSRGEDISFTIITDRSDGLPPCLTKTSVLRLAASELPSGFSSKLHLDRYAATEQTLFIDADCFCLGPLAPVFERFNGRPVTVVGWTVDQGEWFGDVSATCKAAGVLALPKFNGGVYYLERGDVSSAVYRRARYLEPQYDALGLVRLRGLPNDELLMAIAMAQENCWAVPDDGTIMGDFLSTPEVLDLDVLRGRCRLRNPRPPHPRHVPWFGLHEIEPKIVHFLGSHVDGWRYKSEVVKLKLVVDLCLPRFAAWIVGSAYSLPGRIIEWARHSLRPLYRRLFGVRKVRVGSR